MRFHFLLTNHYPFGCYRIEDIVVPVAAGLAELGHFVTYGFDADIPPWPTINLVVENFNDPAVVDEMARRRSGGSRYCFGLLAHEDLEDDTVFAHPDFPHRRRNLERALTLIDFGWSIIPTDYGALPGGERMRFLEYGYVPALRREDVLPRDIDVLFYGDVGARRLPLFNALVQRGLSVTATFGLLPDFMKLEFLDRCRVVADVRRHDRIRYLTPTRIVAALHAGVAVVSEQYDTSPLSRLYRYVAGTELAEFCDLCATVAPSPRVRELGAASRDLFAAETSMARNLRAAMTAPIFAELAA